MNDKDVLLLNIDKLHTTLLGNKRIKKNLNIEINDIVSYLKDLINKKESKIYKNGKNYYCEIDNTIITINSYNYCIITAHKISKKYHSN